VNLDFVDYLTILGAVFLAWLVLVLLFAPHIPYRVEAPIDLSGDHFVRMLECTCQSAFLQGNKIDVLTNGPAFYPAMLAAIRAAEETVNLEVYMFRLGDTAEQVIEALSERARAGVKVTVVMDAIGSFRHYRSIARRLRLCGCRVERYQRMTWYRLARLNNRTHRELLVVDGRVAFVGGAGVADWWAKPLKGKPIWRDTAARIEGPIVSYIQGIAAENWLECCGEILTSEATYKPLSKVGSSGAFAIKSSPADRATISRVLFQTLIEASGRTVKIHTPYFLPDKPFRHALARVVKRGVEITVIVPGSHTDQQFVRLASRRSYGTLLKAGVRVFEYQPGMMHAKTMVVDDLWSVIGSTNLDNRSFEHNDEVNIAIRDKTVAARVTQDFDADLKKCDQVSLKQWKRRTVWEKLIGTLAWILERQQ
jgi:cardiolipin synthase